MFPGRAKQISETLGSLSLPVAIIHLSELIERRDENGLRIYRYLLTDIGRTLSCTVKLTKEDKIAGIELSAGSVISRRSRGRHSRAVSALRAPPRITEQIPHPEQGVRSLAPFRCDELFGLPVVFAR